MRPTSTLQKVKHAFSRDRDLPVAAIAEKVVRFGLGVATAPVYLRDCSAVGKRVRTMGAPSVQNFGRISIGPDAILNSSPVPVRFVTGLHGNVEIGSHLIVNYGASIASNARVTLGDRVTIGPYVRVCDYDGDPAGPAAPIEIEDDVWLTVRVHVRKGVRIGAGTIVTAGSVVTADLPGSVIAGGNPARVIKPRTEFVARGPSEQTAGSWWMHDVVRAGMLGVDAWTSRLALAKVDACGPLPRVRGQVLVRNAGTTTIGARFRLQSTPQRGQITTGHRGLLAIGDDVVVGMGCAVHAEQEVRIGDRVTLGDVVMVMDTNFHGTGDFMDPSATAPIRIEDDVTIGDRVTILKGTTIGRGATIACDSVVSGEIPAGVLAAGVLARVVGPAAERA